MNTPMRNPHMEYHADDYGLFLTQSGRILDCYRRGNLNGVSVMPNSEDLEAAMALLGPAKKDIAVTVHLNLVEGKSLALPAGTAFLTDDRGSLSCRFGSLLLRSYLPGRKKLRESLRQELRAQIAAVAAFVEPGEALRLDGHAHYHMLPVVFDALMDVIREENLHVSYIRQPREFLSLYLRHWKQLKDFSPINLVKVAILNLLVLRSRLKYGTYLKTLDQKLFLGVFLSGRMYRENVEPLLADAVALARKRGWDLEILAHPGGVYEAEDITKLTNADDVTFLTSDLRNREATLFELPHREG